MRSTRSVTLTADGERLLVHARGLLALNDAALRDLGGAARPLLVDVIGEGLTAARVVETAKVLGALRDLAPEEIGRITSENFRRLFRIDDGNLATTAQRH